jgi:G3E family GTPase
MISLSNGCICCETIIEKGAHHLPNKSCLKFKYSDKKIVEQPGKAAPLSHFGL